MNLDYEIKLRKLSEEEGGGWFAEISQLPGCMSDGESYEEALTNLNDAKRAWIETSLELGRPIPEPTNPEDFSGQLRTRIKTGGTHESKGPFLLPANRIN